MFPQPGYSGVGRRGLLVGGSLFTGSRFLSKNVIENRDALLKIGLEWVLLSF